MDKKPGGRRRAEALGREVGHNRFPVGTRETLRAAERVCRKANGWKCAPESVRESSRGPEGHVDALVVARGNGKGEVLSVEQ